MLGKIPFTYNGLTINAQAACWVALQSVSGIHDVALRHTRRDLTGAHGVQDYDTFAGSRVITFEGILIADTEANMATLIDAFKLAFTIESNPTPSARGSRSLMWQDVGEIAKEIDCRVERVPTITEDLHATLYRAFIVSLIAEDPRVRSQAINTTTMSLAFPSGGLTFPSVMPVALTSQYANQITATNAGNFSANATITITCPTGYTITSPRIDNATAGTHAEYSGLTMVAGDVITITPATSTIYTAATGLTTDATGYLTPTSAAIYITSGANTVYFTDSDSDPLSGTYTRSTGSWAAISATLSWQDTWI